MNLITFNKLTFLVTQVPALADLYEKRNPLFSDSVKEWIDNVEGVLKNSHITLAAEMSTLKMLITSAKRGVQGKDIVLVSGHISRRRLMDAASAYSLRQAQQSLQVLLRPVIENFSEAEQIGRKILVMANGSGILNARLRTKFESSTLPSLWKDIISNENLAPWATRMLEMVTYGDALMIINKILDEWINDHISTNNNNLAQ